MFAKLVLIVIIINLFIHYPRSTAATIITMAVAVFPISAAVILIVVLYIIYLGRKSRI